MLRTGPNNYRKFTNYQYFRTDEMSLPNKSMISQHEDKNTTTQIDEEEELGKAIYYFSFFSPKNNISDIFTQMFCQTNNISAVFIVAFNLST
jgi:hypothetical protein